MLFRKKLQDKIFETLFEVRSPWRQEHQCYLMQKRSSCSFKWKSLLFDQSRFIFCQRKLFPKPLLSYESSPANNNRLWYEFEETVCVYWPVGSFCNEWHFMCEQLPQMNLSSSCPVTAVTNLSGVQFPSRATWFGRSRAGWKQRLLRHLFQRRRALAKSTAFSRSCSELS